MNPNDLFIDKSAFCSVIARTNENIARLKDYDYVQRSLLTTNVAKNRSYQRKFKSFYRVRRDYAWCEIFFEILEREKYNKTLSFREVLKEMYERAEHDTKQGKQHLIERSFSSKLVATVDPCLPVWDKHVLRNLGLKVPKDFHETVEVYSRIQAMSLNVTQDDGFGEWRRLFDRKFPQFTHFTDIKKLDLYLWQKRG